MPAGRTFAIKSRTDRRFEDDENFQGNLSEEALPLGEAPTLGNMSVLSDPLAPEPTTADARGLRKMEHENTEKLMPRPKCPHGGRSITGNLHRKNIKALHRSSRFPAKGRCSEAAISGEIKAVRVSWRRPCGARA